MCASPWIMADMIEEVMGLARYLNGSFVHINRNVRSSGPGSGFLSKFMVDQNSSMLLVCLLFVVWFSCSHLVSLMLMCFN